MTLELIPILIALAGTAYSAWTDFKTGFVSDFVSHAMIAAGVAFTLYFNLGNLNNALPTFAIAAGVFGIGFLMYLFGQLGGGDVKLFTGLTLLVPHYPAALAGVGGVVPQIPSYPFIVSLFLLSGLLFMFVMPPLYLKQLWNKKRKIESFNKKLATGALYIAIILPMLYFWTQISKATVVIFVPMAFGMLIIPFKNDIVSLFFATKKPVAKLDEEDVLALEVIDAKVKKKLGLWRKTFTNRELEGIKKKAKQHYAISIFHDRAPYFYNNGILSYSTISSLDYAL